MIRIFLDNSQRFVAGTSVLLSIMLSYFVIALLSTAVSAVNGQQCWVEGSCDGGFVLGASKADSKEACLGACQLDPECQWFSYFFSTSICLRFSGHIATNNLYLLKKIHNILMIADFFT